jgi:hypothetical protein
MKETHMQGNEDPKLAPRYGDRTTAIGPQPATNEEVVGSRAGRGTGSSTSARQNLDPSDCNVDNSGPGPRLMTASTLKGDGVVNGVGEDLGKIEEIMLDVPQGRVAYAVLSFGGSGLFAIPWTKVT